MQECILCLSTIPNKTKPEHVLLNALGGRKTVQSILCPVCNHKMGIGPDQDLAESVRSIRNMANLRAGDGDNAPPIHGLETDGVRFDLKPGMVPVSRPKKALQVDFEDDFISIKINASSKKHADVLLTGAARKIAKRYVGHEYVGHEEVVEAIKKDLAKDGYLRSGPAPKVHRSLSFGEGKSQQAMAKAALVLWADSVKNEETLSSKYDSIREFIWTGNKSSPPEKLIKVDTRPLPEWPDLYGTNPNLIWVGSNSIGQVFGYFRLYGAIGWRVLLCEHGGTPNMEWCLISNPMHPAHWSILNKKDSPLTYEWVSQEWQTWPLEFEAVSERLEVLGRYAQNRARDKYVEELALAAFESTGLKEGDIFKPEDFAQLSNYLAPRLTAFVTKTTYSEPLYQSDIPKKDD